MVFTSDTLPSFRNCFHIENQSRDCTGNPISI